LYLIDWLRKEIKIKNIFLIKLYSKCGLALFIKMLEHKGEINLLIRHIN
jgi:hypothetical protein